MTVKGYLTRHAWALASRRTGRAEHNVGGGVRLTPGLGCESGSSGSQAGPWLMGAVPIGTARRPGVTKVDGWQAAAAHPA
jgi:hypothetical protein